MWTFVLLLTALISTILLTLRFLSLIVKTAIVAVALTLFSTIATVVFLTVSVLLLVTVIALILLASLCLLFGTGFTLSLEITALRFSCYFLCFRSDLLSRFASSLATAGLAGSDFSAFFSALAFGATGFASALGAAGLKLATIFSAASASTLDEWLFTSKPQLFCTRYNFFTFFSKFFCDFVQSFLRQIMSSSSIP